MENESANAIPAATQLSTDTNSMNKDKPNPIKYFFAMKCKIFLLLCLMGVISIAAVVLVHSKGSSDIGSWHQATSYPFAVAYDEAIASGNYIYVLGAGLTSNGSETNMAYYALTTQDGIVNWTRTTDTPINAIIQYQCAAYNSKIYCIGAYNDSSYFANISSAGIGSWSRTTKYPINVTDGTQCFSQENLMCCFGGVVQNYTLINDTYCTHLGNSGMTTWTKSINYPTYIAKQRVFVYNGYVYSIGGLNASTSYLSSEGVHGLYTVSNASYYAKINSDGIGDWIKTTNYPYTVRSIGLIIYKGYAYGIGGLHCTYILTGQACDTLDEVFYAPISSTGIGAWTASAHSYPFPVFHQGCIQVNRNDYCIGGIQTNTNNPHSDIYYANLSS